MKRNFEIELLAPAKDKKCAFTAINCGADAIYIGANSFGARKNAGNSIHDIKEVIDYAHKFGVKVFVTINTVLYDNELPTAQKLIDELYKIKTDAIIIQDMGLMELKLPPIALHSSTQCHNATVEKVQFLEAVGFQRAILARELSIDEIKKIAQNTTIELESFVQGALCVSYSGQCYLSYAIGGRSANRGECAQPCRKRYSLEDANGNIIVKNQHLLCLKDFNASEHLERLIDAGVSSFKIEGRLKDENYIKNVVSFYRQKLDQIILKKNLKRSSIGISKIDFIPTLEKTFNRGFCDYFLEKRSKNIASFSTPKNRGELIGKISALKHHSFKINNAKLNKNDGITFFDEQNELCGTKIEKIDNDWVFPNSMEKLKIGTEIFKNLDYEFLKQLEITTPCRKIPINIILNITKSCLTIKIKDELNNEFNLNINHVFEEAQNKEKSQESIKKQLCKMGNTEFFVDSFDSEFEYTPFIKVNEINEIRRTLVENFQKLRNDNYQVKLQNPVKYSKFIKDKLDFSFNITNEKAKSFYEKCGSTIIEYGLEHPTQKTLTNKPLMETKHCLKYSLGFCSKTGKKLSEPLVLIDEKNQKYKLCFDCKNCKMKIYKN